MRDAIKRKCTQDAETTSRAKTVKIKELESGRGQQQPNNFFKLNSRVPRRFFQACLNANLSELFSRPSSPRVIYCASLRAFFFRWCCTTSHRRQLEKFHARTIEPIWGGKKVSCRQRRDIGWCEISWKSKEREKIENQSCVWMSDGLVGKKVNAMTTTMPLEGSLRCFQQELEIENMNFILFFFRLMIEWNRELTQAPSGLLKVFSRFQFPL